MANIRAEGNLKASITIGDIVGVTDKNLEAALSTKADKVHTHDEYLTEHQSLEHLALKSEIPSIDGLATESYVNNAIDDAKIDTNNFITNEQLTTALDSKANENHNHDNVYVSQSNYTELSATVKDNSERIDDSELLIINNSRKINTLTTQKLDSDTSYDSLLTNDKTIIGAINEIFEMVRSLISYTITVNYIDIDGNVIQDPYIFTVKPDEEYNVGDEAVIDGYFYSHTQGETQGIATDNITINIIYKANPSSEFYAEYRIDNETSPIDTLQSNGYLPTISEGMKVFALKTDGQYTDKLDILVSEVDTIRVEYPEETKGFMFPYKLIELVSINITNFTSFNSMFAGCHLLKLVEVADWDTSNITSFSYMFEDCENLLVFNAPNWDTRNVTKMNGMFDGCISLTNLHLNNWDTSSVNILDDKAEDMFYGVPILTDEQWGFNSDSYVNFTLTEYQTGYRSIFPWTKEPESDLFSTTYTINSDSSSPVLYSGDIKDETIFAYGSYMPKFDTGYTYVELLLNDGTITTNLGVPVEEVQQATVWYSEETKDISFSGTKVKDVTYINLKNIEILSFTDCTYLESVDLSKTTTKGNCVTENTFENVPEECKITISKDWETTEEQAGFIGTYTNPWKYCAEYTIDNSITDNLTWPNHIPSFTTEQGNDDIDTFSQDFNLIEVYLKDGTMMTEFIENTPSSDVERIVVYYPEETKNIHFPETTKTVEYVNIEKFTDLQYMFIGCSNLIEIMGIEEWDIRSIETATSMFYGCNSLTSLDLSNWDISNVTDMMMMFFSCFSLEYLNLSTWDMNGVDVYEDMLADVPENLDWGYDSEDPNSYANFVVTEEQTGFNGTFPWNKQEDEENPYYIEYTISSTGNTLEGKPGNYLPQISIDGGSTYTRDYKKIEITLNDDTITSDLTTLADDVKLIKLYYDEQVTAMKIGATGCRVNSINYIKTDNFTKLSFSGCQQLKTIDLSSMNLNNITEVNSMFYLCSRLTEIKGLQNLNTSNVTDMSTMFMSCKKLTYLDLSNFNTSNVTKMSAMFENCSSLTSLDLSSFDTSNVTDMGSMFNGCSSLTSLNVSNFNTSNVTSMYNIFYECSSLTSLDLSNFDTSKVTDMQYMFYKCSSLTSLDLSNFDTSKVTDMGSMFSDVPSTVDWCYDGTNYQNWTLTEEQTGFSGTFPWNVE